MHFEIPPLIAIHSYNSAISYISILSLFCMLPPVYLDHVLRLIVIDTSLESSSSGIGACTCVSVPNNPVSYETVSTGKFIFPQLDADEPKSRF